jgi:Zn-dependent protease with chaperone function
MIPSTPRRTWLFLLLSSLAYFGPGLLAPAAWQQAPTYAYLSAAYQGLLVVLGFVFGPAVCRALVVGAVDAGPLSAAIARAMASLESVGVPQPPVLLFEHPMPFVLTAGLLPSRCAVFVSTGLAGPLSPAGLRFVLARAAVHASLRHRIAALVPLLAFTVLVPDDPKSAAAWFAIAAFLAAWLLLHWAFELDADRCAARAVGIGAGAALQEWLAVAPARPAWLSTQPPLRWRLRATGA